MRRAKVAKEETLCDLCVFHSASFAFKSQLTEPLNYQQTTDHGQLTNLHIRRMLTGMSRPLPLDADDEVIDISPTPPGRRHWRRWVLLAVVVLFFALSQALSIYIEALWFGSLG